jgi:hypothetical protein
MDLYEFYEVAAAVDHRRGAWPKDSHAGIT